MTRLSLPILLVASLCIAVSSSLARASKNHALRHTEQSVVVLWKSPADTTSAAAATPSPQARVLPPAALLVASGTPPTPEQHAMPKVESFTQESLGDSMGALLATEQEVMTVKSPKAELQRKLVSLIWLERVLQQNLNSMEEDRYRAKIAKSKAGLEKDTSPATADMLAKMRSEMHEFSVPFFQKAVEAELADNRARQKVLLDKILAIEAGQTEQDLSEGDDDVVDGESSSKHSEKKEKPDKQAAPVVDTEWEVHYDEDGVTPVLRKKKARSDTPKTEPTDSTETQRAEEKAARRSQSNFFIFLMVLVAGILVCMLIGIAMKVHSHQSMRNRN